ncbi:nuclear transport factor 2 family protein [Halorarius litoreus]|uniref:nuclear transport factor 2 family protein n=1 Tax=Halorarius litoreus TaxID=2962676 RepID=UPI0020CB6D5F|nr:nuclear transport factor 2 family protein [Halorarius litoreus]
MPSQVTSSDDLLELLQGTYFDSIDGADAETAVTVMHDDVEWVHTQVWEHDGHTGSTTDTHSGRDEVFEFLDDRIGEMQTEGIEHKVRDAVYADGKGAFRAEVVGPDGSTQPFMGWVELTDGKISTYIVGPERMPE